MVNTTCARNVDTTNEKIPYHRTFAHLFFGEYEKHDNIHCRRTARRTAGVQWAQYPLVNKKWTQFDLGGAHFLAKVRNKAPCLGGWQLVYPQSCGDEIQHSPTICQN